MDGSRKPMMALSLGRVPVLTVGILSASAALTASPAHADNDNTLIPNNSRLNNSVVSNVYTLQHQAGCTNDVKINPQLQLAAQWHAQDLLKNRSLDGEDGSDGSKPQDRANAAGFRGKVAETVAINPAIAISGIELINKWYYDPVDHAIMSDCANNQIGVWSENSPDRTIVVAVYGQPQTPVDTTPVNSGFDPNPDYDASDEIEYGIKWFPWILRGVYPPPAYPPN
jgi:uncharacterized protein YkwD